MKHHEQTVTIHYSVVLLWQKAKDFPRPKSTLTIVRNVNRGCATAGSRNIPFIAYLAPVMSTHLVIPAIKQVQKTNTLSVSFGKILLLQIPYLKQPSEVTSTYNQYLSSLSNTGGHLVHASTHLTQSYVLIKNQRARKM